jgi:hypothetical protein
VTIIAKTCIYRLLSLIARTEKRFEKIEGAPMDAILNSFRAWVYWNRTVLATIEVNRQLMALRQKSWDDLLKMNGFLREKGFDVRYGRLFHKLLANPIMLEKISSSPEYGKLVEREIDWAIFECKIPELAHTIAQAMGLPLTAEN